MDERRIEAPQYYKPIRLAFFNTIELIFQFRGEFHIEDLREMLHEKLGHYNPQFRWPEIARVPAHIVPGDDRVNYGRVGRWSADPKFLKGLYQRRVRISGRRLCEVLARYEVEEVQWLVN